MKISVAMCTYNGEKYIGEQLRSIASQTILPDEVVICDDGSTDKTISLINHISEDIPFEVKVIQNQKNLGSTKNFEKAISLTSGDIIFLSDQDDVWREDKVEKILEIFKKKDCAAVFTNAIIVDSNLNSLGRHLWDSAGFRGGLENRSHPLDLVRVLLNHNVVTGATMAFKSSFVKELLPIPEEWVHDAWIALILSFLSTIESFQVDLILYRQHNAQQIGAPPSKLANKINSSRNISSTHYEGIALQYRQVWHRLQALGYQDRIRIQWLQDKISHNQTRSNMRNCNYTKRLKAIMLELISRRYFLYSNGLISAVKDMIN